MARPRMSPEMHYTKKLAERLARLLTDHRTHGLCETPECHAFENAKQRATNPRHPKAPYYCLRGIRFRFGSFYEFWWEVGPRPSPNHSIDRINPNGDYCVGNIRWATAKEQATNRRPRKKKENGN